jgi:hypothetical protein
MDALRNQKNSRPAVTAKLQRLLAQLAAAADLSTFADRRAKMKQLSDWMLYPASTGDIKRLEDMLLLTAAALANGLRQLQQQQQGQSPVELALLCLQQLRSLLARIGHLLGEHCHTAGLTQRLTDTGGLLSMTHLTHFFYCCCFQCYTPVEPSIECRRTAIAYLDTHATAIVPFQSCAGVSRSGAC